MVRIFGSIILAGALSATAAMAETPFNAADAAQPAQAISTRHVDFHNRQDVDAFYARLHSVALNVCAAQSSFGPSALFNCVDATVADAVHAVNRPMLTALASQHDAALRTATAY